MIIVLSLLFMSISISAVSLEPVSAASTNINSTMTNSEIQTVLDNAASGDTINFLGTLYENIQLTINKTLNIVTNVGTVLSGSDPSGSAVFLSNGPGASGPQISGFNITSSNSGIIVNNTNNVNISNCNISAAKGSAVTVNKSSSTNIKNSGIKNSITGVNISNSQNTSITGSTIQNNKEDGVNVENSINTTINNDNIINNKERGVKIYNSNNTVINGSNLKSNGDNSSSGISSDEGAISVKNSSVKITHNKITDNSQGVTVVDSSNVAITNNTINNNHWEGILLNGTLENISIKDNDMEQNGNGVVFNYKKGNNIIFSGNIVTKSVNWQSGEDSGIGIKFGPDYTDTTKTEVIEHNAIFDNDMDMRAHDANGNIQVGSNWYGNGPLLCWKIRYAAFIEMALVRTGRNTYETRFYDGTTGQLATDFPSIPVTFTSGEYSITIMTQNGKATITIPYNKGSNKITATAYGVSTSIDRPSADLNPPPENNTKTPNNSKPKGTGNSNKGNGVGSGDTGTSGGATSGAPSTVGLAAAAAAAGDSGQSGTDSEKTKTAQELFIKNTVKNPTVWGIIGVVVLLLIIFGAYYRKDLMNMIKKSKK